MAGVHVAAGQAFRTGPLPSKAIMANGAVATLLPNTQYTFSADVDVVPDVSPALAAQNAKRRRDYPDKMERSERDYQDKAIVGRFAAKDETDDIA